MATDYTSAVAQALEDAFVGERTFTDPLAYNTFNGKRWDAKYGAYIVHNELIALRNARIVNAAYGQLSYTCLAGLNVGDPVYISAASTATLALATTAAASKVIGFVRHKGTLGSTSVGAATTCFLAHYYYKTGLSGLTVGDPVYLTDAGAISATQGTVPVALGIAITTTTALLYASTLEQSELVTLVRGLFSLTGDISPAQLVANTDNYNPTGLSTASTLRLSTDASRNLTGIAGGSDGRILAIHNVGSFNLVLIDDATSTAANRFQLNANVTVAADQSVLLQYDSTSSRWRMLAGPGGGTNALLDGVNHTDTAAQAVTRGSLIYGNATPAWDELTIGAANALLGSDGTDAAWFGCTAAGRAILDDANAAAQATTLGLGTGDSPQFTAVNIGHATDTTLTRVSAGVVAIEGNNIYMVGGADVAITDGGTGASTAAGAATALGVGTGDSPQFTAVNIGHATDTTITRVSAGVIAVEGSTILSGAGSTAITTLGTITTGTWNGTDIAVADGGTGASTAAAARTNLGIKFELICLPGAYEPPATIYATLDLRNAHPVLDFDGSTDEEAVWTLTLPNTYGGGGLTVDIFAAFTTATSGNVGWAAQIERIDASSLDIDADSFAALQGVTGTAAGTSGQIKKYTITFTDGAQMDSVAAGEVFRLKIRRDADGTTFTDDITTDAEVVAVVIRET